MLTTTGFGREKSAEKTLCRLHFSAVLLCRNAVTHRKRISRAASPRKHRFLAEALFPGKHTASTRQHRASLRQQSVSRRQHTCFSTASFCFSAETSFK
jgi:hypothetical protein